jgi:hypothetical protein
MRLILFVTLGCTAVLSENKDISEHVGKTNWWGSNINSKEFIVNAQDPNYRCGTTLSDSMSNEHKGNSLTEAMFILHT